MSGGHIEATWEPDYQLDLDIDPPSIDVRIDFAAIGGEDRWFAGNRYYHPNDPDGPEPPEIEFDAVSILAHSKAEFEALLLRIPTAWHDLEAWAKTYLAGDRNSYEAREVARDNYGPDPDYERERRAEDAHLDLMTDRAQARLEQLFGRDWLEGRD